MFLTCFLTVLCDVLGHVPRDTHGVPDVSCLPSGTCPGIGDSKADVCSFGYLIWSRNPDPNNVQVVTSKLSFGRVLQYWVPTGASRVVTMLYLKKTFASRPARKPWWRPAVPVGLRPHSSILVYLARALAPP